MAFDRLLRALNLNAFAIFNNPAIDQQKKSVRMKTTGNLAVTASGSGAGKTLTATGNGAFSSDGISGSLNDRVLVAHQTTGADNGVYTITTVGTAGTPYVLTRATDFDGSSTGGSVTSGIQVVVEEGTAYGNTTWQLTNANAITIDTTALTFRKIAGKVSVIALTDAATIAVDAALFGMRGDIATITLGASHTLGNWTNGLGGQTIEFQIKPVTFTLSYDTKYRFSTDVPSPTLPANLMSRQLVEYQSTDDKFDTTAVNKGF